MDMNELKGKVLKVNLARPVATVTLNPQSTKASASWTFHHNLEIGSLTFHQIQKFGNLKNGCKSMSSHLHKQAVSRVGGLYPPTRKVRNQKNNQTRPTMPWRSEAYSLENGLITIV
jgi:hypothetical protein